MANEKVQPATASSAATTGMEMILNQPIDQINKKFIESMFAAYIY